MIKIQTILFSISTDFVYTQLNIKTVLFQTIQLQDWNLTIRLFSVISRTLFGGVLSLYREAFGVFCCPSRLGKGVFVLCTRTHYYRPDDNLYFYPDIQLLIRRYISACLDTFMDDNKNYVHRHEHITMCTPVHDLKGVTVSIRAHAWTTFTPKPLENKGTRALTPYIHLPCMHISYMRSHLYTGDPIQTHPYLIFFFFLFVLSENSWTFSGSHFKTHTLAHLYGHERTSYPPYTLTRTQMHYGTHERTHNRQNETVSNGGIPHSYLNSDPFKSSFSSYPQTLAVVITAEPNLYPSVPTPLPPSPPPPTTTETQRWRDRPIIHRS